MPLRWQRRGAALLLLVALAGCRSLPPAPASGASSWDVRKAQLQAQTHFGFKGRVAVAAAGEGFNADIRWAQDNQHSQVSLEGPLGVGGAQISADGNELTLVTSRGEHIASDAAHAALAQRLGFDPPLASLRYWVLGVPDPSQPASEELDTATQRLSALTQLGWHVGYAGYVTAAGEALPARLTLQRDDVRVRLLVDDWQ
jgi:outer membrane lipoprotein LolB